MVIIFVFSTSNYTLWKKKKKRAALKMKRSSKTYEFQYLAKINKKK